MLEGLSYSEIAAVLGISETNVGARLTRARQMLRARL
jgi:RNA polymerase sigma-70 factor, ECF subfamily